MPPRVPPNTSVFIWLIYLVDMIQLSFEQWSVKGNSRWHLTLYSQCLSLMLLFLLNDSTHNPNYIFISTSPLYVFLFFFVKEFLRKGIYIIYSALHIKHAGNLKMNQDEIWVIRNLEIKSISISCYKSRFHRIFLVVDLILTFFPSCNCNVNVWFIPSFV